MAEAFSYLKFFWIEKGDFLNFILDDLHEGCFSFLPALHNRREELLETASSECLHPVVVPTFLGTQAAQIFVIIIRGDNTFSRVWFLISPRLRYPHV